jgi:hypothetical protein
MPIYTFENTKTGEEFELEMKIAEKDVYLKKNKNIIQTITHMNIGDSVRMGITKPPSDFSKYILGRIKDKVPGATAIERRHNIPREW